MSHPTEQPTSMVSDSQAAQDKGKGTAVDSNASTFEEQQKRSQEAKVIGNWEIAAWYAMSERESIFRTRLNFLKRMINPDSEGENLGEIYEDEDKLRKAEEGSGKEYQMSGQKRKK